MRKRKQLEAWLASADAGHVDSALRDRLARELAPISPGYLRRLLIASGIPMDPLVEGVRQDSLDHAQRTLVALSACYARTPREARALVIQAKDHARLALVRDSDPETRARRQELIDWMIVWVNDPALFPTWVRLRRQAIESRSNPPE